MNFTVVHEHEYGTTIHYFDSEHDLYEIMFNLDDEDQKEFVNDVLGIDWEPEKEETIEISVTRDDVVKIDNIPDKFLNN